jgi:hypothetical protein
MKPQLKVRQRFRYFFTTTISGILGSSAVVDQSFDACAGVLIPSEMDEIGSDDLGLRRDSAHGLERIKRRAKLCLKVADFRDGSIASSPIQATFFRSPPVSRHAPPKILLAVGSLLYAPAIPCRSDWRHAIPRGRGVDLILESSLK